VKEVLKDGDLEKVIDITLEETETIWMLDTPTVIVAVESEEADSIRLNNEKYHKVKFL
jgi:hypothetical protein